MSIRITSDSTCDLGEWVKKREICILPLKVNLDMQEYYDGVDITPEDIFAFVEKTGILPKTSAPSISDYEEFFERQLAFGDEVLHFNISSKSSVSYNNATKAAERFGGKVRTVDSKALSSGQGLLVLKAADLRDEGKSLDEIEECVLAIRERVNTSFVPDCLEYLYKGGRVSGMVKTVASMFKIHPLIKMQDGQLVPDKKYKGRMQSLLVNYVDDLKALYPRYEKTRCFITHSGADAEIVESVKKKVSETFAFDEIIETVAGSIITSHCGKGTLGVLFIYE